MIGKVVLLAAVIAVALIGAAYLPGVVSPATSSTSQSSTSVTQTTATSCTTSTMSSTTSTTSSSSSTSTTTATSTTSTTASSTSSSGVINGSFTYSPSYPLKVEAVQASTDQEQGVTRVTFQLLSENIGTAPIYVLGGCSGGLSSSIVGNSSVIQQTTGGPLCDCAAIILTLRDGQNHTATTPGCWSGYYYDLVGAGIVDMNFTLNWSSNGQDVFGGTNSTTISAQFTFG